MNDFTVTLKQLRDNKACVNGYNKLVCHLKGAEYIKKSSYIRFKHDAEIPLLTILESNGLDDALWCLKCNSAWQRDARLFAVWCARQVEHLTDDVRVKNCNDIAERFANGSATKDELAAAWEAAWAADAAADAAARAAADAAARAAAGAAAGAVREAARAAAWAVREAARAAAWEAAWAAARAAAGAAADAAAGAAAWEAVREAAGEAAWAAAWAAAGAAQKEMFILMCNNQATWSKNVEVNHE